MIFFFLNWDSVKKMHSSDFCFDLPRKLFIPTQFGPSQHLQVTMENSPEKRLPELRRVDAAGKDIECEGVQCVCETGAN